MTIVAIDGPAGSGKSTIARLVSKFLDFEYVDSGAIYRTMTLYGMDSFEGDCQLKYIIFLTLSFYNDIPLLSCS